MACNNYVSNIMKIEGKKKNNAITGEIIIKRYDNVTGKKSEIEIDNK